LSVSENSSDRLIFPVRSIISEAVNVLDPENLALAGIASLGEKHPENDMAEVSSRAAEESNSPVLPYSPVALIFCVEVIASVPLKLELDENSAD
jgi:hypothetical protein